MTVCHGNATELSTKLGELIQASPRTSLSAMSPYTGQPSQVVSSYIAIITAAKYTCKNILILLIFYMATSLELGAGGDLRLT